MLHMGLYGRSWDCPQLLPLCSKFARVKNIPLIRHACNAWKLISSSSKMIYPSYWMHFIAFINLEILNLRHLRSQHLFVSNCTRILTPRTQQCLRPSEWVRLCVPRIRQPQSPSPLAPLHCWYLPTGALCYSAIILNVIRWIEPIIKGYIENQINIQIN